MKTVAFCRRWIDLKSYLYDFYVSREQLIRLIRRLEKAIETAPEGYAVGSFCKGTEQFYWRGVEPGKKQYLNSEDRELLKQLVQKSYDRSCLVAARKIEKRGPVNGTYCLAELVRIYERLSEKRQGLVNPYVMPTEEYVRRWNAVEYDMFTGYPQGKRYVTNTGVDVRSKSEMMIGNLLTDLGYSYRYEMPVDLPIGVQEYPDFMILDHYTREVILYEHFGRMDEESYRTRNLRKINYYLECGYRVGIDFMFSFESDTVAFNYRNVERTLTDFLTRRREFARLL